MVAVSGDVFVVGRSPKTDAHELYRVTIASKKLTFIASV
jgi:hypothetical protein